MILAGSAIVVLVAAGCASSTRVGDESATDFSPGAGVIPAGLESFYTQQVQWGSCDGYGLEGSAPGHGLDCARITVPIDYENPRGGTAQIAISRSRATGEKVGSLLVNPGGPGASGLGMASVGSGTELAGRFDVIGFDPRGVGASTPQVRCRTDAENDLDRQDPAVDMSPEGIARLERKNQDYAAKCVERTGADLLEHVGTREVVRDMDVIRAVLGDAKLNYLGFSYGTRLGTVYSETFPRNVRAMVLDGALDPEQDPVDEMVLQGAGFQQAFDAFAADCAKYENCPLGTDPTRAVPRFRSLVDPLIEHPAATTDPRGLGYRDAITGVQQALYSTNLWGSLRGGLDALTEGRGDTLLLLADLYEGRRDDGTYSNITDAFNAVRCVDDPPVTDRAAADAADVRYRQAAPFLDDGRGTGNAPLDVCAFWPVPHTGNPHSVDAPGLPTVLVVSTTEDPATPYQAGVDLAKQLGAVLITFRGTQHTVVLDGHWCVDVPVVDYLVNLAVPEGAPTC